MAQKGIRPRPQESTIILLSGGCGVHLRFKDFSSASLPHAQAARPRNRAARLGEQHGWIVCSLTDTAHRRRRRVSQGIRAGADRRDADGRARGLWSCRLKARMGRDGVCARDRSGNIWRTRCVYPSSRVDRASVPRQSTAPGVDTVRLPGERGLARRRDQTAHGVALQADILPALEPWSIRLSMPMPRPLTTQRTWIIRLPPAPQ